MSKNNVVEFEGRGASTDPLNERLQDGVRESTQSWREVLLKLKSRGMSIPKLVIGDGAMGFWAALEEVYPQTRQQRCWMHKT